MADTTKTPIYNPSGAEKDARDLVYRRKREMEDNENRQRAMKNAQKWRRMWEMQRETKNKDDWQSNHIVPTTLAIVETILSEVIDSSPRPLILPRSSDDAPKALIMEHVFNYTWEIADGDMALYDVLKDAFILGTGIGQEYYWKEPRKVTNNQSKDELIYDFDDVYMEAVKFEDFFPDEKGRGFSGPYQCRDAIRRYIMHYDDFKLFFQGDTWDPLKNAHLVVPGGDTQYHEDFKPPDSFDKGKDVEVLWYWSRSPLDALYIVANGVLIVKGPNPFKHKQLPFARAVDVKRPHDFYGKGEPEILESIVDESNTLRQMIIDRNHLDIDKMFFVSPNLNLSDEDLIARPHGAIPTDDMNSAKAIEYGDIPRSVEMSLKQLEDDSTIATGINPRAQALPSTGTATEAAIIKESTLKRIRLKMRIIEKEFLVTIGRLRVSNILQYYSQPKLEKIVGAKETADYQAAKASGQIVSQDGQDYKKSFRQIRIPGKEISFDATGKPIEQSKNGVSFFDLKPDYFMPVASGGFDIKFEAGSTLPVSKALLKTEANEIFDRLSQVALAVPNSYDIMKLGDDLLKTNDKNPGDYHSQQAQDNQQQDNQRLGILLDLAAHEDQMMMQGKVVPPTPYSSPAHTQVHVQFTKSPPFQALKPNSPIINTMTDHITGEVMAQGQRAGGGGMSSGDVNAQMGGPTAPGGTPASMVPGSQPAPQAAAPGGVNTAMQAVAPAQIQGGGQVARG